MKKLVLTDFTFERIGIGHRYYCKLPNGKELDLESCLNGYDVALYDEKLNIIGDKVCTNLEQTGFAILKALEIGNKLLNL